MQLCRIRTSRVLSLKYFLQPGLTAPDIHQHSYAIEGKTRVQGAHMAGAASAETATAGPAAGWPRRTGRRSKPGSSRWPSAPCRPAQHVGASVKIEVAA